MRMPSGGARGRGSIRSIRAPSAWSRRAASSTPSCRTAGRSVAALIRAAISRSDALGVGALGQLAAGTRRAPRSAGALRHRGGGMVGQCPDEGDMRPARRRRPACENVPIAPKTSSPATSGATTIERMPDVLDDPVGVRARGRRTGPRGSRRSGRPRARRRRCRTSRRRPAGRSSGPSRGCAGSRSRRRARTGGAPVAGSRR